MGLIMIPLSVPNFEGNEEKYVLDAVHQGWVSTGGSYVTGLEKVIASYLGISDAVACQSGTAALHLALIESGITSEDAVIVPALTFIAAVNPVRYIGATPIFMDCDDSLCMDAAKVRLFCTEKCYKTESGLIHRKSGKIVKAIIVVHVFGNLADMEQILQVAHEFGLTVIEDATEALGSRFETGIFAGKYAGTIGDFGAYSFNGNKIITTGGGGMLVSSNTDALSHARYLSTQAKDDPLFYKHSEIGFNYRMTNVQAAIGVAQMEELEEFISRKNSNWEIYKELLANCTTGNLLSFREGTRSNKWFYSFLSSRALSDNEMHAAINHLHENGIQTRPIWGLIPDQLPYKQFPIYKIEKAKFYYARVINIPCSTNISVSDIKTVCNTLNRLFDYV